MSASRPDHRVASPAAASGFQRAVGSAEIGFVRAGNTTRLSRLAQSGSLAVRLPRRESGDVPGAVVMTTCGGLTGGDRMSLGIDCGPHAAALVTTQAAEKVYRSAGGEAGVETHVAVAPGASLEWLPQETILFDGGRLRRSTELRLAADARLLTLETIVLGRVARGEQVGSGFLSDAWRIRRDGRLVWADTLRIDGAFSEIGTAPSCFAGAAAVATLVLVAPDAGAFLERARAALPHGARAAVTAFDGLLLARALGRDAWEVRAVTAALVTTLRREALGRPARLPRPWDC